MAYQSMVSSAAEEDAAAGNAEVGVAEGVEEAAEKVLGEAEEAAAEVVASESSDETTSEASLDAFDTSTDASAEESTEGSTGEASEAPSSEPLSISWCPSSLGGEYALMGFICGGPLLGRVGISKAEVEENLGEWVRLGAELAKQLQFDVEGGLSYSELGRIFHYYLPVYFWCVRQIQRHRSVDPAKPLVIGISAPQGCGKTTVVESLNYLLHLTGWNAASVSLDDFYLTNNDQNEMAAKFPGNRLLELRGNAGSHDLDLAESTVLALLSATDKESPAVRLPRYDKSAFSGKGDRAPAESWHVAQGPVDVVLLEGWMLGFSPLTSDEEIAAVDPQLVPVNKNLAKYEKLHSLVESWIVIEVEDPDWVFQWRLQAEVRMRNAGKPGMTDEEVADFVSRYIPAYKAYLKGLYEAGPPGSDPQRTLVFHVDQKRNPTRREGK